MIIGLTGQTGAGKTQVCEVFTKNDVQTVIADNVSREVTGIGMPCLNDLVNEFSDVILNPDKSLNRRKLAQIVFSNVEKLKILNKITHPYIIDNINFKITQLINQGETIILLDAPTLFESGADKICDKIIVVVANIDIRRDRIIKRDNLSIEQANLRINAQKDEGFYTMKADFVINNDSDLESLIKATQDIIELLKGNK